MTTEAKTILSLCDYTGNWSSPYKEAGYNVIRVDLQHGEDAILWPSAQSAEPRLSSEFNDVRDWIGKVQGVIAQPVCTYFSGSGARHKRSDEQIRDGLALVDACIRIVTTVKPAWWVMENPVGKLVKWIGDPTMRFQPYEFGDPYTKKTCLWGDFNTELERNVVEPTEGSKMHAKYGGSSMRTKNARSETPMGFARAFFNANR